MVPEPSTGRGRQFSGHKVPEILQDITEATPIRAAWPWNAKLHVTAHILAHLGTAQAKVVAWVRWAGFSWITVARITRGFP